MAELSTARLYAGKVSLGASGSDLLDAVLDLLRASGCRVTTSRRLLIGTLLDLSNHISAEQLCDLIQQKAPDISISTIYRNLEELERLEIVMHSHLGHGPAVYHLAWAAYAHLVCSECGATLEIPEELFADLATQAAVRYGFTVDPRHFAILGQCRTCETGARIASDNLSSSIGRS
jgi:Fe2+ or Zn2+ uptake regulation protein